MRNKTEPTNLPDRTNSISHPELSSFLFSSAAICVICG